MGAERYGRFYWCVELAGKGRTEVFFHADRVEVTPHGDLVAWGGGRPMRKDNPRLVDYDSPPANVYQVVAFAAGSWRHFYAASIMDGGPIAVEHWKPKGAA